MDFTFTDAQQAAAEAARAVFADVAPDGGVPSPAVGIDPVAPDIDRELWQRLSKSDLVGIALDEGYGGAGLDEIAWCLVLRESARVLARVPLLDTGAAALAVQAFGTEELRRRLLPEVVAGRLLLGVAAHGRTGHEPADEAVTALPVDGGWTLTGEQTGVAWAPVMDLVLVPARGPEGTLLLLVDPRGEGVTLERQVSTHGELAGRLLFDGAVVDASWQLGPQAPDGANWRAVRARMIVGVAALCLGLGEAVLRLTSDYASKREQFGHAIATFQAVAMQSADRYIDLRSMEVTLWQAAWRVAHGVELADRMPLEADLATAKIWSAEGVRAVASTAQHLHGGIGADLDYPLHRYHAWAKHLELTLGPAAAFEQALGDLLAEHQLP
ncbi:acyl-CoA dehydrogenase family protein [Streptacidiphilus jiangxiensis]|uniref:acyl-CoA dehydrogenase family protein n=1 Tax=Streptacidiphilus jiangxiensis TaxID=235985 RepID=UPI0005AA2B23|nr:acyl-CoA dehydrogenase family protein [Streptacidiphilus jiangxiensis]